MADHTPATETARGASSFEAPHPGSKQMPRWETGELIPAPRFTWRNWAAMIGPGLVMGGAAIGGGEWLTGPAVTARYGGSLLWLATLSILGQLFYNIEISRYTLYCGEPIFVGKFRVPPFPMFWVMLYLVLDVGSIFPYLAANAATPLAALFLGKIPGPEHEGLLHGLSYVIFLLFLAPLVFGGKVYNSIRLIMSIKIFVVLGFLSLIAILYSSADTWRSILTGFFQFGTVPLSSPGGAGGAPVLDNWFVALSEGRQLPALDMSMVAMLSGMVAIAGSGGLTNTLISAYTRDQGWGMGWHVGAVPSMVGGQKIELSHVGKVFDVNAENLARWRGWVRHILRDQIVIWTPACFIGLALPSMLSVEFLPKGFYSDNKWAIAGMTANGVGEKVAEVSGMAWWGSFCWFMVLVCGVLVLAPSTTSTADGFIRRWVDVIWTGSGRMRQVEPGKIKQLYFGMLIGYIAFGLAMLAIVKEPKTLLEIVGLLYNYALGVSCWHVLAVNTLLLPKPIRPHWFSRVGLFLAGIFFITIAVLATIHLYYKLTSHAG